MSEQEQDRIELVEDQIPLEGIRETAVELVSLYGGEVLSQSEVEISFLLPLRRGVAASGVIDCRMSWSADAGDEGTVILSAAREAYRPRLQHIAILVVGVIGATLWLLWPFFPNLGTASWVGAAVAFAAYFLTLRRTGGGVAADLLQRLASVQRERGGGREGEGN
jgi:hypothetical protein